MVQNYHNTNENDTKLKVGSTIRLCKVHLDSIGRFLTY